MRDNGFGGVPVGDLVFPAGVTRKVLDNLHIFYTQQQVDAVLSAIVKETYVSESYDCDNFSIDAMDAVQNKLRGCPFGFATGRMPSGAFHAVNVFFLRTNGVLQRLYYDATARKWLTEFDVDFLMV